MAEQTEEDVANYIEQRKKVAKWGKYIDDNAAMQIGVAKRTVRPQMPAEAVEIPPVAILPEEDDSASRFAGMDWGRVGFQDS